MVPKKKRLVVLPGNRINIIHRPAKRICNGFLYRPYGIHGSFCLGCVFGAEMDKRGQLMRISEFFSGFLKEAKKTARLYFAPLIWAWCKIARKPVPDDVRKWVTLR